MEILSEISQKWSMEQRHLMQVNKVLQLHANVEIVNFKSWKRLLTEFEISNILSFSLHDAEYFTDPNTHVQIFIFFWF